MLSLMPTWTVQLRPRPTLRGQSGGDIQTVEVWATDWDEAARLAENRYRPMKAIAVSLCSATGPA